MSGAIVRAVHRADVDARVALDAEVGREVRFDVAVQTAFDFSRRFLGGEAELDLDVETLRTASSARRAASSCAAASCSRCCSSTRACRPWS